MGDAAYPTQAPAVLMARPQSAEPSMTLWQMATEARINPLNGKCTTLPILSLRNQYSRNFHL